MAGKLSKNTKLISMKLICILAVCIFATAACNNEASVQDKTDSARQTSDTNSNRQQGGGMTGTDSIPSLQTNSDSLNTKTH